MSPSPKIEVLEAKLNDFDLKVRTQALNELLTLVNQGQFDLPAPVEVFNMHCHTFFSFNAYGHSPTSLT